MRPSPTAIDPADLIGPVQEPGFPELRAIAVTTLGGGASLSGTSESLGNDTDTALLLGLRQWSDVVLVGAKTAAAEDYAGVRSTPSRKTPAPLAVITRSLSLDPGSRLFTDTDTPPLILIPQESLEDPALNSQRHRLVDAGAQLISTGQGSAQEIIAALHALGYARIACEGGPGIYAMLFEANLVDILHLTIEPVAHAPVEKQLFSPRPDSGGFAHRLQLEDASTTADSTMFLRYKRGVELHF
ncbi:pyrimidine reductase family protein [Corynebacterium alimapuense]|uniref:Bacterial bifunctional deaminase-reductase C-terminal domain-containing protein n=1 Tax=Corynebacterium alimapuense TaxID=1576874 RepID=A0A3M8K9R6_9CORY|nr:pyrimidine reductase family protein [Corynebacterium alimapuense]RNE49282.1 hypothetical protein C5L39_02630 [Corynebacterium alimapuense]